MSQRALLTALIIALLSLALTERTLHPLRSIATVLITPVSSPLTGVTQSVRSIATALRDIRFLRDDVRELTQANRTLTAKVAELDALRHENDTLRAALAFSEPRRDQSLLPARIVARSPERYLQSFTIDKGEADGVKANAPVIADGFLVGIIAERFPHRSTVRLLTSSDSLLGVILSGSRAQGLLRGGLNGLTMTQVPLDVTITPNEPVVTSGLGGTVPANLPIGVATATRALPSNILQEIDVHSPIPITQLELVFVSEPTE